MLITGDLGVREMSQQTISIIELFAGIGAQVAALKRLGVDYKVVGISEIDKYAIQSYNAINGPTFNYGDITKIPMLDYADLWTYSFPCQDLSVAGKQAGISEGTRSGLLLHVERLLETAVLIGNQPKYLLLENVKALVSKKFKPDFDRWLQKLESLGYNNYWQVLNAKDYGVPQNRERVFVVSIRKDVDTKGYKFPTPVVLTRKLKDVLEPVVDEKYYLSQDKVDKLVMNMDKEVSNTIRCGGGGGSLDGKHTWDMVAQPVNTDSDNCARTICSNYYKQTPDNVIGVGYGCTGVIEPLACASRGRNPENPSDRTAGAPTEQRLEINTTGCSNTLTSVEKDNYLLEPSGLYIHDSEAFHKKPLKGLSRCLKAEKHDSAVIQLGNIVNTSNWDNPQAGRVYSSDDISPTLNTMQGGQREPKILQERFFKQAFDTMDKYNAQNGDIIDAFNQRVNNTGISPTLTTRPEGFKTAILPVQNYRIRKLTPLECWRLMDFTDDEFYAAQLSGVSNSQLYKQAGNSIVVAVLQAIFKELLA